MRAHHSLLLALGLTVTLTGTTGCKKEEKTPAAKAGPKTTYGCFVQVAKKPAITEVSGQASNADEKAATEAAWTDVCAKLPEADRPDCRDPKKWAASLGTGSGSANGGPTTYTVTVKLEPITPVFTGKAKSEVDEATACKDARANACEQAGEKGDCVAAGTFAEKGQGTSKETMN